MTVVSRRGSPGGAPQVALIGAPLTGSEGLVAHRWKQRHRQYPSASRLKCNSALRPWAGQDSNLGRTDYESAALTAELPARGGRLTRRRRFGRSSTPLVRSQHGVDTSLIVERTRPRGASACVVHTSCPRRLAAGRVWRPLGRAWPRARARRRGARRPPLLALPRLLRLRARPRPPRRGGRRGLRPGREGRRRQGHAPRAPDRRRIAEVPARRVPAVRRANGVRSVSSTARSPPAATATTPRRCSARPAPPPTARPPTPPRSARSAPRSAPTPRRERQRRRRRPDRLRHHARRGPRHARQGRQRPRLLLRRPPPRAAPPRRLRPWHAPGRIIAGVAPQARLVNVKAANAEGVTSLDPAPAGDRLHGPLPPANGLDIRVMTLAVGADNDNGYERHRSPTPSSRPGTPASRSSPPPATTATPARASSSPPPTRSCSPSAAPRRRAPATRPTTRSPTGRAARRRAQPRRNRARLLDRLLPRPGLVHRPVLRGPGRRHAPARQRHLAVRGRRRGRRRAAARAPQALEPGPAQGRLRATARPLDGDRPRPARAAPRLRRRPGPPPTSRSPSPPARVNDGPAQPPQLRRRAPPARLPRAPLDQQPLDRGSSGTA